MRPFVNAEKLYLSYSRQSVERTEIGVNQTMAAR